MTLKEKRLAFLNDTVAFYNSNNRSVKHGHCLYHNPDDGNSCAIGMRIEDKRLCAKFDSLTDSGVSEEFVFNLLPSDLKLLGQEFLYNIQKLHDCSSNWEDEGLSEYGKVEVIKIISRFELK